MPEGDSELARVVAYMSAHWPSAVKEEWQVPLDAYPALLEKVIADLTKDKTTNHHLTRIAGLSGSGKTTQLLPAVEAYYSSRELSPVLVAARLFAPYHPHYQEILDFYGASNVRRLTDEFSTIMMFLVLSALTAAGYDIILDVTFLDPAIEAVLVKMLSNHEYQYLVTMIAISPIVAERHLGGRSWRHSRETEQEFIRATSSAIAFYANTCPNTRIVLWDTYQSEPIYDGPISASLDIFDAASLVTEIPPHDEAALRAAKITYFTSKI